MSLSNGNGLNGRFFKWGLSGVVGVGSVMSAFAFIINLWVAPLKETLLETRSEVAEVRKDIKRIAEETS